MRACRREKEYPEFIPEKYKMKRRFYDTQERSKWKGSSRTFVDRMHAHYQDWMLVIGLAKYSYEGVCVQCACVCVCKCIGMCYLKWDQDRVTDGKCNVQGFLVQSQVSRCEWHIILCDDSWKREAKVLIHNAISLNTNARLLLCNALWQKSLHLCMHTEKHFTSNHRFIMVWTLQILFHQVSDWFLICSRKKNQSRVAKTIE